MYLVSKLLLESLPKRLKNYSRSSSSLWLSITLDLFASDPFKTMLSKGGNYEIVAISTEKNIFLITLIIKQTLGNIFIKMKNPPGGATITK